MVWSIEFSEEADRDFAHLDKSIQRQIYRYLHGRIATSANPRNFGKRLQHQLSNLWRYRVADYRVLCAIDDERLIILVVEIGHRSTIYER